MLLNFLQMNIDRMKKLIFNKSSNKFIKFIKDNTNEIYNLLKVNVYKRKKINYY